MTTDNRGHTVPASTGHPARSDITALSLSMCDVVPVTNTTTRATAVTNLGATTAKPLIVARADARADSLLEISSDAGVTWRTVALGTGQIAYVPTLTSTGTNPTMGTGATAVGSYNQVNAWVSGYGELVAGTSGFAAGTGAYRVLLPIATTAAGVTAGRVVGQGTMFDASAGTFVETFILVASTTTTATMIYTGGTTIGATAPVVPANNDQWRFSFGYEAA
jgi:hypothetical protein